MVSSKKYSEAMSHKRRVSDISAKIVTLRLSDSTNQRKDNCSALVEKNVFNCNGNSSKMQKHDLPLPGADPVNHSVLSKVIDKIVTTPPNAIKIPTPMPLAPVKQKNCRIMSGLKPKKLVYVDSESEFVDRTGSKDSGFLFANRSLSDCQTSARKVIQSKENIRPQKRSREINDTKKKSNSSSDENAQIFRRITRSTSKFYNDNNKENLAELLTDKAKNKGISNEKNKVRKAGDLTKDENSSRKSSFLPKKTDVKSKGFNPNCTVLSQCSNDLTWQETLHWLQPRRDVGLWIQCSRAKCQKWRYVEEYHDPVDVPDEWFCEMNRDQSIASCNIPEIPKPKEIEDDLIENKYNAGSIVWAHIRGFPWWPAMVDDSPETMSYYKLPKSSTVPKAYHVIFFSENLETAWISPGNIKPFAKHSKTELVKKTVFANVDYVDELDTACALAQSAIKLSIFERLQRFSFLTRFMNDEIDSAIGSSSDFGMIDNTEEEINSTFSVTTKTFSIMNTTGINEDCTLSSQLTTETAISTTGNLQNTNALVNSDSEEDYIPNSQPTQLLKKNNIVRRMPTRLSPRKLLDTQLTHLTKDNVVDTDTINATTPHYNYITADTMSLTHNIDSEEDCTPNSQSSISSTANQFWEKSQSTNNKKSCLTHLSPSIPRKQMKLDYMDDLHKSIPTQKYAPQNSVNTLKNVANSSSKPLTTLEKLRKRWEENAKKYKDNLKALSLKANVLSG